MIRRSRWMRWTETTQTWTTTSRTPTVRTPCSAGEPPSRRGALLRQPCCTRQSRWDLNPRWAFTHTRFRVLRTCVQSRLPVSAPCSTSPPAAFAEPSRTTTNETKTETTTVAVGSIRTHVRRPTVRILGGARRPGAGRLHQHSRVPRVPGICPQAVRPPRRVRRATGVQPGLAPDEQQGSAGPARGSRHAPRPTVHRPVGTGHLPHPSAGGGAGAKPEKPGEDPADAHAAGRRLPLRRERRHPVSYTH